MGESSYHPINAKRVKEKISEIEETVEIHERYEIIGLVYQDYINKKKKTRDLTDDFLSASPNAVLETHCRDNSHSEIRSTRGWVPFCFPTNADVYNVGEAWDVLPGPAMVMKRTFTYSKSKKCSESVGQAMTYASCFDFMSNRYFSPNTPELFCIPFIGKPLLSW